jgi:hypothetical protein
LQSFPDNSTQEGTRSSQNECIIIGQCVVWPPRKLLFDFDYDKITTYCSHSPANMYDNPDMITTTNAVTLVTRNKS